MHLFIWPTILFISDYSFSTEVNSSDNYNEDKALTPPDNNANKKMTDLNFHKMGIPVNLCTEVQSIGFNGNGNSRQMVFATAIVEGADRSYDYNWNKNLEFILFEK